MKKHLMALAFIFVASSFISALGATDYPWMTFTLTDNSEVSVPSENLLLTYSNGELHLTSTTVDQTLPLSLLKSMRFETCQAGIGGVDSDANTSIEVFYLNGVKTGVFHSIEEAVTGLPHGAYIFRTGKTTQKVMF